MTRRILGAACVLSIVCAESAAVGAWGPQGHRLVALVAAAHLTPAAQQQIAALLDGRSLADVATWADQFGDGENQTSFWHYVNMPPEATRYDRNRDCPVQPGVQAGGRADTWRDCVVDRIRYHEERLKDVRLDRADRAIALKFLVHLVGDLHQPMHAISVERGGNGIPVVVFGSPRCTHGDGTSVLCNLHGVWDTSLIAHRGLTDRRYLADLEQQIASHHWTDRAGGTPEVWALGSHDLAKDALVKPRTQIDEAYYRAQITVIDEQLALGGLRLAAVLNEILGVRS